MSAWKQKFDMRCRRLLGVIDDSVPVLIYTNGPGADSGGCDTCGYGALAPIEVHCGGKVVEYSDLGMLINELDEVVL